MTQDQHASVGSNEPSPSFDEVDVVRRAFRGVDLDPQEMVPALHDDEILALLRRGDERLVPYPTLADAGSSEAERALARGVDLVARRPVPEPGRVHASEVLALTRLWQDAIAITQRSADTVTHTAAYLRADRLAVVEDVGPDGSHRFLAAKRAAALDLLTLTAAPFDLEHDEQGEATTVTADAWPSFAERELAAARIVSVVRGIANPTVAGRAQRTLSVFALDDRTVTARPHDDGGLVVETSCRRQVRRHLVDLIATPPEGADGP